MSIVIGPPPSVGTWSASTDGQGNAIVQNVTVPGTVMTLTPSPLSQAIAAYIVKLHNDELTTYAAALAAGAIVQNPPALA